MVKFEKLTKRNAQEYFDAYLSNMDASLERFAKKLRELGVSEKAIDFSPESLVPVWKAVHPLLKAGIREETKNHDNLPLWYWSELANNPFRPDTDFTPETLDLIDGLAYYVARVFWGNVRGAHWEIDDDPRSHLCNKPIIITGAPSKKGKVIIAIYPVHNMIVAATSALRKALHHGDESLLKMYNAIVVEGW